jgi:hypothetical protein
MSAGWPGGTRLPCLIQIDRFVIFPLYGLFRLFLVA